MIQWIAKYWLEFLFGALITILGGIVGWVRKRLSDQIKKQHSIELGMQALLRDRITQAYYASKDKEYCPPYMLENVLLMYEQYKNLGGNSFVTKLVEEMKEMPMRKEDIE